MEGRVGAERVELASCGTVQGGMEFKEGVSKIAPLLGKKMPPAMAVSSIFKYKL